MNRRPRDCQIRQALNRVMGDDRDVTLQITGDEIN